MKNKKLTLDELTITSFFTEASKKLKAGDKVTAASWEGEFCGDDTGGLFCRLISKAQLC